MTGKLEQYGVQGGPNPRNLVDISFPPTQLERDAHDEVVLAEQLAPLRAPNIWVPFSELLTSGAITRFVYDQEPPEWWVLYAMSFTTRVTLTIAQGFSGETGSFAAMISATVNDRFVIPGRQGMLFLQTVTNQAQVVAYAIRGFDPSTF